MMKNANTPVNPTTTQVSHTPEPWAQGKVLITAQTKRWSPSEIATAQRQEELMVFSNFNQEDKGVSRQKIATCLTGNDARRIIACVNACEGAPIEDLERLGKDYVKPLIAMIDANNSMIESLTKIASYTQDSNLLWWQVEARKALQLAKGADHV